MLAKASLLPVPLLLAVSKNWELHFGSVRFERAIKQHLQYFNAVIHYQTSTILYYISGAVQRKISFINTINFWDRIGLLGSSRCHIITPTARLCSVPALLLRCLLTADAEVTHVLPHNVPSQPRCPILLTENRIIL